jgi:hypothetical protein
MAKDRHERDSGNLARYRLENGIFSRLDAVGFESFEFGRVTTREGTLNRGG